MSRNAWFVALGLVTGRESYQNTRGNTVHATQAVGIFDLPENRKP